MTTSMQRDTRQRRAIRRAFERAARPLSPDEVLEQARRLVPSLGRATVYRNVKSLQVEGWLSEVDIPGGGLRYELAERPPHHYFLCRICKQAFDVPGCPECVETLGPPGFEAEGHEVTLHGRCADCV